MSAGALIVLLPLLVMIALVVWLSSPGPALFRQQRVGRDGQLFTIWKFRTMYVSTPGSGRSGHKDARVTGPGHFLRRAKLDELPQLWNVLCGEMAVVGPRPKLPGHDNAIPPVRPGLTGAASVAFAGEEHLVRDVPPAQLEECHEQLITPRKLALDQRYLAEATLATDLRLIWMTLCRSGRYTDLKQLGDWAPRAPRATRTVLYMPVFANRNSAARTVPMAVSSLHPAELHQDKPLSF